MKKLLSLLLAGIGLSAFAGDPSYSTITFRSLNSTQFNIAGGMVTLTNASGVSLTDTNAVRIWGGVSSNGFFAAPFLLNPYLYGVASNNTFDLIMRNLTAQSVTVPGPFIHYDSTTNVDLASPTNNVSSGAAGWSLQIASVSPPQFKLAPTAGTNGLASTNYVIASATALSNYVAASAQTFNGPQNGFASFQPETVGSWIADQTVITNGDGIDATNIWYHDASICVTPNGMVMLTYGCTTNGFAGPNYPHIRWRQAKSIEGLQTTTNYGDFPISPYGHRLNSKVKVFDGIMWMMNYAGNTTTFEEAPLFGVLSYCSDGTGTNWNEVGVIVTNKAGTGHFDQDKVYMTELNYVPGRPDPWVCTYYGSWSNDTHCAIGMSTATNPFVLSSWHQLTAPIISNNACGLSPTMRYLPNLGWMFFYYNYLNGTQLAPAGAFICTNQWFEYSTNYLGPFDINVYDPNNNSLWIGNNGSFFDDNGPALTRVNFTNGNKIVLLRPYTKKEVTATSVTADTITASSGSFNGLIRTTNLLSSGSLPVFVDAETNQIRVAGGGDNNMNFIYTWAATHYETTLGSMHITNSAGQWQFVLKGSARYGKTASTTVVGNDWTNMAGSLPDPITYAASPVLTNTTFSLHSTNSSVGNVANTNDPAAFIAITNNGAVFYIKAYQ